MSSVGGPGTWGRALHLSSPETVRGLRRPKNSQSLPSEVSGRFTLLCLNRVVISPPRTNPVPDLGILLFRRKMTGQTDEEPGGTP